MYMAVILSAMSINAYLHFMSLGKILFEDIFGISLVIETILALLIYYAILIIHFWHREEQSA